MELYPGVYDLPAVTGFLGPQVTLLPLHCWVTSGSVQGQRINEIPASGLARCPAGLLEQEVSFIPFLFTPSTCCGPSNISENDFLPEA